MAEAKETGAKETGAKETGAKISMGTYDSETLVADQNRKLAAHALDLEKTTCISDGDFRNLAREFFTIINNSHPKESK